MYLPELQLHQAETLEDATALMERHAPAACYLAGGTDLVVDLKVARAQADHVISLGRIGGMRSIEVTPSGLDIGALTTLTDLNRASLPVDFAALQDATSSMAAPNIRNVATVGGNLASAVPCADLPPPLLVLDAQVDLFSSEGTRGVPLTRFFIGPRSTVRTPEEILTRIHVPAPPKRSGAAYFRFALREGNAIAVASAAAALTLDDAGRIDSVRIALGAVAPTPTIVHDIAPRLLGRVIDESALGDAATAAMEAAEPITDVRGSAAFRRELCGILTRRALETAAARASDRGGSPSGPGVSP